jgi:hypothetical protein
MHMGGYMSIAHIVAELVGRGEEDLAEELIAIGAGKWMGSNPTCDICGKKPKEWFVDGKTKMGPWALMCERDFPKMGVGIGPGRGQKYDAKTMNKIEGKLDEALAADDPAAAAKFKKDATKVVVKTIDDLVQLKVQAYRDGVSFETIDAIVRGKLLPRLSATLFQKAVILKN